MTTTKPLWNPHPKQLEFLNDDRERVLWVGGQPNRADYSWIRRLFVPIDKPYAYHKPSTEGLSKINRLREAFSFVEREIDECCPNSRQKSIAITNNEQTAMWAIKAVVFNDPKSEVENG